MENERTHLDLFSGIGGFALAARANGVRTVQFVEIDPRCRAFLAKAWPGVPIWDDVKTFALANSSFQRRQQITRSAPANEDEHARRAKYGNNQPSGDVKGQYGSLANASQVEHGRRPAFAQQGPEGRTSTGWSGQQVWLLTGGVPCQPASRAGKQRGKEDHRWLWPEALRVIAEVQPTWALLENPPGIGDVGLAGILSAVEAQGYEVRMLSIPACAVGAPHRRERFWIIARRLGVGLADSEEARHQGHGSGRVDNESARRKEPHGSASARTESHLADPTQRGQREHWGASWQPGYADQCCDGSVGNAEISDGRPGLGEIGQEQHRTSFAGAGAWSRHVWLPCADGKVRRAPDSALMLVDGSPLDVLEVLAKEGWPHRSILGALGNSIVWQVAAKIIKAMVLADTMDCAPVDNIG